VQQIPASQFVVAWSTDDVDVPARFDGFLDKPITIAAASEAIVAAVAAGAGAFMTGLKASPCGPAPTETLRRSFA